MRPFGCRVFTHIPYQLQRKLDPKSQIGFFLGYSDESKGYRTWDPKRKPVIISRDVLFAEHEYFSPTISPAVAESSRIASTDVPFTPLQKISTPQKNSTLNNPDPDSSHNSQQLLFSPSTAPGFDNQLDHMPTLRTRRLSSIENTSNDSVQCPITDHANTQPTRDHSQTHNTPSSFNSEPSLDQILKFNSEQTHSENSTSSTSESRSSDQQASSDSEHNLLSSSQGQRRPPQRFGYSQNDWRYSSANSVHTLSSISAIPSFAYSSVLSNSAIQDILKRLLLLTHHNGSMLCGKNMIL